MIENVILPRKHTREMENIWAGILNKRIPLEEAYPMPIAAATTFVTDDMRKAAWEIWPRADCPYTQIFSAMNAAKEQM